MFPIKPTPDMRIVIDDFGETRTLNILYVKTIRELSSPVEIELHCKEVA